MCYAKSKNSSALFFTGYEWSGESFASLRELSISLVQNCAHARMLQIIKSREHNFCVNKVLEIELNVPGRV